MRNQNIISVKQPMHCFKTLCYLVTSYILKPRGIGRDVNKQSLTITGTRRYFPVLLLAALSKIANNIRWIILKEWQIRSKSYLIVFYAVHTAKLTLVSSLNMFLFSYCCRRINGCVNFSLSNKKSSSGERVPLTPCKIDLTPCNIDLTPCNIELTPCSLQK